VETSLYLIHYHGGVKEHEILRMKNKFFTHLMLTYG